MRKEVDIINRNKLYALGIICALIMCVSGIYAFTFKTTTTVENDLRTGGVNIKLNEYILNENNEEIEFTDPEKTVMPGETVYLIPRISNLGASCYLRVKLGYNSNDQLTTLSDESIGDMGENWKKVGEYWYYQNPVEKDEKIDIFKYVSIPNFGNDVQGKILQLNIIAEAIQSKNFTPNFNSEEPWGNEEILENPDSEYKMDKVQVADAVKVEYDEYANLFLDVPEDFMANLSELMPGDSISYNIGLKPNAGSTEYYFNVVPNNTDDVRAKDLLEKLQLEIKLNGNTVFNGDLYQPEKVSMGDVSKDESGTYTFTVKMPEELNNNYAMRNIPITWTFTTEFTEETKPHPNPKDYRNTYEVELVTVSDDGSTLITTGQSVFVVNDEELKTNGGILKISNSQLIKEGNQKDKYIISQKSSAEGYEKYNETIELNLGFMVDQSIEKYVIDPSKTTCTAPGLSLPIYKLSNNNQKITIYMINKDMQPDRQPGGKYTIELVTVQDDGSTIKSGEAVFNVNDNNLGTRNGILTFEKVILSGNQKDTYIITEKYAPTGYSRYIGTMKINVAFKQKDNAYIIDESKTTIELPGGLHYKITDNNTKITIYVTNLKIPVKPEDKSPQTGDVKVKIAIGIFIIAAICLIIIFAIEKKNKNKEK